MFILLSCALGIALGIAAHKALPNIYESKLVVLSDLLTKTYGDQIDQSLNNLIAESNLSELSAKLGLTEEKVSTITSIKVECLLDVKTPQREKVEKDETYFIVTVHLTDLSVLPDLEKGLLHYFRNNDLVKIRTRQRAELSAAVVERIDSELRLMDSLKRLLFQRPFKAENLNFDPAELFIASAELTKMRWENKQELELAQSIHLVEGFTVFQKPKDPKLLTLIILGFIVGLVSSIGLLTLKHLFTLAHS